MLKKIKKIKIKNLTLFSEYQWDENLPDFKKYNLFYGGNGSGKTTLSKLFDCFGKSEHAEFTDLKYEIETYTSKHKETDPYNPKIRVFNEDYTKKNIQILAGKANPIFILGETNQIIAEQIKNNEQKIELLEKEKQGVEKEKQQKKTSKDKKFTDIAFCIKEDLRTFTRENYTKKNAEKDFSNLSDSELKILKGDELSKQRVTLTQEQRELITKVISGDLDFSSLYNKVESICKETVTTKIISRLAENNSIADWVEKGLPLHDHNAENQNCKFCGNIMSKRWIKELRGHFNDADKKLKDKIDDLILLVQEKIKEIKEIQKPHEAQFYKEFQASFMQKTASFDQEKANGLIELDNLVGILERKRAKTTEIIPFSNSPNNRFKFDIDLINKLIEEQNNKTNNFKSERHIASETLTLHHLSKIYSEVKGLEKDIEKLENKINEIQNESDILKKRVAKDKKIISSGHRACDTLNQSLKAFLGRDEIFFEVSQEGGYVIKRNGIVAKNLSEGEKTAVAFIYFVTHLQDNDFDLRKGILVIDDPISSFDSNSLFQAFAFLKNAVKDAKQIFILTHNFDFLKLLLNWLKFHKNNVAYYMIKNKYPKKNSRSAYISELDELLRNHESEYHYLFKMLYEFRDDESIKSAYHIPNIARKVLDTFLMFRVPKIGSTNEKLDKLKFDSNKKTAIYSFTNNLSHITGDGFNPSLVAETKKNVKYLLEMIAKTSPEHFTILVEDLQ